MVAGTCRGVACEWLIPLSLLIPLVIVVMVAVTGIRAASEALRDDQRAWTATFGTLTVLGVIGPAAALLIWRDHPDAFVAVATVLLALVPGATLVYRVTVARHG